MHHAAKILIRPLQPFKVIAVNQDPLGKQGFRVVGGNFTTGNNPISVASCNAADPNQKWTFSTSDRNGVAFHVSCSFLRVSPHRTPNFPLPDTPAANYVHNAASNQCFNVDNCGQDIIAYDCVTSGGTCAGKTNYANMQFVINANGTMSSPVHPGECVAIAADNTLWLSSCNSGSPKWSFSSSTGLVCDVGESGRVDFSHFLLSAREKNKTRYKPPTACA